MSTVQNNVRVNGNGATTANPKYAVSERVFVGVEHPFSIQSPAKAIESLGGHNGLTKLVAARESETFETAMNLHPGRQQSSLVISGNTATKALICQVTLPKIIGRKRKRGDGSIVNRDSNDQQLEPAQLTEQQRITKCFRDRPSQCSFQVLGQIKRVHKFRTMPDFVWSTQNSPFMRMINESIKPCKYDKLHDFHLKDNDDSTTGIDLVPPPVFSPHTIPFNYVYQQNTSVKVVVNADGEAATLNEGHARRSLVLKVAIDVDKVPSEPPAEIPPLEEQGLNAKELVAVLAECFEERPIWSRRAIYHRMREQKWLTNLKWLFQYVGYEFATGPWAMTVIKYGVDPRADPKYRIYQSITLHFDHEARNRPTEPVVKLGRGGARRPNRKKKQENEDAEGIPGYIFTGRSLVLDGKTWQVCDFEDTLLRAMLDTTNVRQVCDVEFDGWYKNGTWAKVKVIFRYKARCLKENDNSFTEDDFARASEIPDDFNPVLKELPVDVTGWSRRAIFLAYGIRHAALSFGKNRTEFMAPDVTDDVRAALRKHDTQDGDEREGSEDLADLLEAEQNMMNQENPSGDEEEDEDEEQIGEDEVEDNDEDDN